MRQTIIIALIICMIFQRIHWMLSMLEQANIIWELHRLKFGRSMALQVDPLMLHNVVPGWLIT